jgi:prevent-host-death family protein
MSDIIYNLYEAKTSLSRLVDRAANGEEIILSKAGKPLAKLVPFNRSPAPRQPGGWEGKVRIAEDFDAPLPEEIQAAFESRG